MLIGHKRSEENCSSALAAHIIHLEREEEERERDEERCSATRCRLFVVVCPFTAFLLFLIDPSARTSPSPPLFMYLGKKSEAPRIKAGSKLALNYRLFHFITDGGKTTGDKSQKLSCLETVFICCFNVWS